MKSTLNKNLTNIRNFLVLLKTENPTQEEVVNFLLNLKTFVFNQYGLNENDYNITIQFVSPKVLDYDEASMFADEHNNKKFTIYLNKEKLSGKNSLVRIERNNQNKKTEQQTSNIEEQHNNRIESILALTQSFLHEIGHVMQYILQPKQMQQEDELKTDIYDSLEHIYYLLENSRKKRLLIKTLNKHINALAYMSAPEKDANRKSYIYFANVLAILLSVEEDDANAEFFCILYHNLNLAKKYNYELYRKYTKENREAIKKLHDLEIEKELANLTKSLM